MNYDIFFGVDGTGPYSDGEYGIAFATSYVRQIFKSGVFNKSAYLRGPGTDGLSTGALASTAAKSVENYVAGATYKSTPRVFLAGYSRGGAAVIQAAHLLKAKKINVHGLFLFDAVDRSLTIDKTYIPSNVCFSRHAMRDPTGESRGSFSNCGTEKQNGVDASAMKFLTTHGGMGGTPWGVKAVRNGKIDEGDETLSSGLSALRFSSPAGFIANEIYNYARMTNITPEQEASGSKHVWSWMSSQLKAIRAARHIR